MTQKASMKQDAAIARLRDTKPNKDRLADKKKNDGGTKMSKIARLEFWCL